MLLATLLLLLLMMVGCKDSTCRGVIVEGECRTRCLDSECGERERCVDQRCAAACDDDDDCDDGHCLNVRTDEGEAGSYCVVPEPAAPDASFTPQCLRNRDCDESKSERCVSGLCRITCQLHEHCGSAGSCSEDAVDDEGNAVVLCQADDFPRGQGEYGTRCPSGNTDCSDDFRCISAGEGDADAYCTATGCEDDDACPLGFFCSHNRTLQPPCGAACGRDGDPANPNCIPVETIGDQGAFRCADDEQLELRICLKREYCASCSSDADCRSVPNQLCAAGGDGAAICTVLCDPATNSCPWGSASTCDVWDERLGQPTCGHRYGACGGNGNSCDPCLDDRDCPRGFCSSNPYSQEQFCVDESDVCSCPLGEAQCVGGGCPETPGGLAMNCVSRAQDRAPDACFGAPTIEQDPASPLGCWPR